MSDPKRTLTATEVTEAGIEDWRQLMGRITARFRTKDFATGLELVAKIGEAAEAANHHPDLTLVYTDVVVTLSSHDVGGLTSRDIELARQISGFARELGVRADVAGLTQLEIGLDTTAGARHAPLYAALLGAKVVEGEPVDPTGQVPTLWWQGPAEQEGEYPHIPEPEVEQRWHFDVWVPIDEAQRRLAAVLDAGGRLVSDAAAPAYWVIEDVDGNRSCICTAAERD